MSGARARRKSQVSYAEVESDVDMDEEDRAVAESKQQVHEVKKQKRKSGTSSGAQQKQRRSSPMLDKMLSTALAERAQICIAQICLHLDGLDLIHLSQVNKLMHKFMMAESQAQIWRAVRKEEELVKFEEVGDINFVLLACGDRCQLCGRRAKGEVNWARLRRWCSRCVNKTCVNLRTPKLAEVLGTSVHKALPAAIEPAMTKVSERRSWWRRKPKVLVDVDEMADLNRHLFELQDEDEIEQLRIQNSNRAAKRRGGTRSRKLQGQGQAQPEFESQLEKFVAERKAKIEAAQEARYQLNRGDEMDQAIKQRAKDERERSAAQTQAKWRSLREKLESAGWTEPEIAFHERSIWCSECVGAQAWLNGVGGTVRTPKATLEEDPDGWRLLREQVRIGRLHQAKHARMAIVQRRLTQMQVQEPSGNHTFPMIKPSSDSILSFESVKPLYDFESLDRIVNEADWNRARPEIDAELERLRQQVRVWCIKLVLSCTEDRKWDDMSEDPNEYGDQYDKAWFEKATALVPFSNSMYYWHPRNEQNSGLRTLPEDVAANLITRVHLTRAMTSQDFRSRCTSYGANVVKVCRLLLDVAGLDPVTASKADVETLEGTFMRTTSEGDDKWSNEAKFATMLQTSANSFNDKYRFKYLPKSTKTVPKTINRRRLAWSRVASTSGGHRRVSSDSESEDENATSRASHRASTSARAVEDDSDEEEEEEDEDDG
ncbi:hypothetical protein ACM66B_004115 [Microbotryomycetes sp. NB124-2]